MFFINTAAAATQNYPPAPIEKILAQQSASADSIQAYKNSIVRSYSLYPTELQNILKAEYAEINRETARMQKIKQNWRSYPYPYRLANYKLNVQISDEITQSRKKFAARKKRFYELLQSTPQNQYLYLIESSDPLFFYETLRTNPNNKNIRRIQMTYSSHGLRYLSVFDHKFNHVFTYHRQHIDMLKNRRINTPKTRNNRVNYTFQKLFDDYLTDMKRIGSGLDISNQDLFTKIGDMRNEYRSE